MKINAIALFTVSFAHLHYNNIQHVCDAILGYFVVLALNGLASMLDYIVMQMRKNKRVIILPLLQRAMHHCIRGRVAEWLKSGGRRFKSRSDHLAGVVSR